MKMHKSTKCFMDWMFKVYIVTTTILLSSTVIDKPQLKFLI